MTNPTDPAAVEACPCCKAPCHIERDDPTVIAWKDEYGSHREQHLGRVKYRYDGDQREAAARADERERCVAYLLSLANNPLTHPILAFIGDPFRDDGRELAERLAAAINSGDHLKGAGE